MSNFQPHINVEYPKNNFLIFEEWFAQNYNGCDTDRELLPVFFTSYWVNNNYGNDEDAKRQLQEYIYSLDRSKKYFSICQYDDSVLIDLCGHDVLRFEMSKNIGVPLPLLCQPHPYEFKAEKKYFANFIGSMTHPVREKMNDLKQYPDCYISFENHSIEKYCEILSQSIFTLCPRGHGANSFRISEALQYGSVPVYISDDFIIPYNLKDFEDYCVLINDKDAWDIRGVLDSIPDEEVIIKQFRLGKLYDKFYTYESNLRNIKVTLETEYHNRKQV